MLHLSLAPLLTLIFFLLPAHSHSQEIRQMEHGEASHAHSSAPIPGSPEERAESEFMHQLNGVFVLLLGILAILEHRLANAGLFRWGWPLLFLVSGIYLVIQSDQAGWPIGEKGFIESLRDPEILQHKIAAVILLLLGLSEIFLRTGWRQSFLAWVFPSLTISAGVLLFVHSHEDHQAPTIYVQHLLMGGTAMGIGVMRLISGRFKSSEPVWPFLILLLGLELLFYTE
jgi:putative copper resistance protein D